MKKIRPKLGREKREPFVGTRKRKIPHDVNEQARRFGIVVWQGHDNSFFATVGSNYQTMCIGQTAREALDNLLKTVKVSRRPKLDED